MPISFLMSLAALGAAGLTGLPADANVPMVVASLAADTVHVSPPTGEIERDRASILAALEQVQSGGTLLFAPGDWLVGETIRISSSQLEILGHPDRTTLRGCDAGIYEEIQLRMMRGAPTDRSACGLLELTGRDVSVRNLTFELSRLGMLLGCCRLERRFQKTDGGYLSEGNTFRNSLNGVRPWATEPSTTRGNRFTNTFHTISGAGGEIRILANEIAVPEPERVPGSRHPSFAIAWSSIPRRWAEALEFGANGQGLLIDVNRIEGHPDGVLLTASAGTSIRRSQIRNNVIMTERAALPRSAVGRSTVEVTDTSDATIVGIPATLEPGRPFPVRPAEGGSEVSFEENVMAGNHLVGADGVALAIRRGARNLIVHNTISEVTERQPYPGNTINHSAEHWRHANGSAIWVGRESHHNEIIANTFEEIAGAAVFLEGDSNRVELRSADDKVRDIGSGFVADARAHAPTALADQVTICRDAYGVPHVHGETDAAAVFGYMYAQAEDAFDEVERQIARMVGRLSELDGEAALSTDLYLRALEAERLSREEYERATPFFRAMADAWAAGLNHYLDRHPDVVPRVIRRFEPWQMFAVAGRSESFSVPTVHGLLRTGETPAGVDDPDPGKGSNMWMIGPGKTATGRAMLFVNPHSPPETYLEGHLLSDEGLNVYGGNRPGRPLPVFGHTARHGWTMTNNGPDVADLWRETFDHPTNPLAYRYDDGYRIAEEWTETVRVRTDSGRVAREVTFRKTHHGPIVAVRDGVPLALRIARWEEGGTVQQFHAMARARSFEEFRDAVGRLREVWLSIGYADADGNIWYVHNGAVPRRAPDFDWTEPVDGSDPRTEWQGYHPLSDLPQVLNPESGWLMNTNHSPFRVTAEGENPDPADYPDYMVQPHFGLGPAFAPLFDSAGENARARASRRILSGHDRFTFEEWAKASMSKRAWESDEDIPALVAEWERLHETDPSRAARLRPALDTLRRWDRVSRHESVAMTLYSVLKLARVWSHMASIDHLSFEPPAVLDLEPTPWNQWDQLDGLEKVLSMLERGWGTWRVPYGELSRLQRAPDGQYRDDRASTPVLGGPSVAGMIQLFIPFPVEKQKRWYGFISANSYVSVVEFGAGVRALSVNGSGQSTDPTSPHYTDQAELYGRGAYKPAWTSLEQVQANAVRAYRPGQEGEEYR